MSGRLTRLVTDRTGVVVALLLATFVLLEVGSMQRKGITTDEPAHYAYGRQILNGDSTRFDDSKMPFSALNALPALLVAGRGPDPPPGQLETIAVARYVTVAAAVYLGWVVFRWARELYGAAAGLLALTLFVFDPNILTHGQLVTTDLYAALTMTLALWSFWRLLNHEGPGKWRAATVGAVLFALAQLAKYTSAYLVPIFLLILLGHSVPALTRLARNREWRGLRGCAWTAVRCAVLYVLAFLVVVNLGYWGQDTFRPLAGSQFRSSQFRHVQAALAPVPGLRIPVPWAYIEGLDWVLHIERHGANVYLRGQLGKDGVAGRRFPEYYAVAWLYKEPIATQLLLLLAVGAYLARRRRFDFRRNEWVLACYVLFFAGYFTFVFSMQNGFRYALVVLPAVFVFTGSLLQNVATVRRGPTVLVAGLLLYLGVSVLSYYPHFLPYVNELVWDRSKAYKVLADSNLSWGAHNGWYVRQYLRRHPDVVFEPERPQVGTLLVRVDFFVGRAFWERFRWLRENFEPVDHVAHGHLVFRVTPEALRRVTDPLPADSDDKDY